jgi:hypothetical protein
MWWLDNWQVQPRIQTNEIQGRFPFIDFFSLSPSISTVFDKVLFLEHIQMKLNEEQVRELLCLSHDNFDSNFVVDYQRISEILGSMFKSFSHRFFSILFDFSLHWIWTFRNDLILVERFSWRTFREHPLIESLFIRLTTLNVWTNFSFQFLVSHRFAHHTQLFGKALFTNGSLICECDC